MDHQDPTRTEAQWPGDLSRRDFVKGAAATGIVIVGGEYAKPVLRFLGPARLASAVSTPPEVPPPPPPTTQTHGCTPGFWANNSIQFQGGGVIWWSTSPNAGWTSHGGSGNPPFTHATLFNSFFTANAVLNGLTMWDIVSGGGGNRPAARAARQLIAAYLNAAFGGYTYTTGQLATMWTSATGGGNSALNALQSLLSAANTACDQA